MDELHAYAGVECKKYHQNVGYIHGKLHRVMCRSSANYVQAEGTAGFSEFHLYVCAAFLVKWSEQLLKMDFQV